MDAEIEQLVSSGKLTSKAGKILDSLQEGSYCQHRSWGFGKVKERNLLLSQIVIDFKGKRDHEMQLEYAATSLQPIPEEHILAQAAARPDEIKAMTKEDPVGLVRIILDSYDGSATQDKISASLVDAIFSDEEFRKWWSATKRLLKKDGHFNVPAKRTDPVSIRDEAVGRAEELLEQFASAKQLKDKLAVLNEIVKSLKEFSDPENQLVPLIAKIEADAASNQRLNPAQTVEFILCRDELVKEFPQLEAGRGAIEIGAFLLQLGDRVQEVLEQLPAAKQRGLIQGLQHAYGDDWVAMAEKFMHEGSSRVVSESAKVLMESGHKQIVHDALERWIRERSITSDALIWLCKERRRNFEDLVNPNLLNAIIAALERDQFNEKRTSRLQDLILDDKELISDILDGVDIETAREAMRRLMLTPVFEELSKRSILARIIKLYPSLQTMLTSGDQDQKQALIVSWKSLDERKKELEELVNKKIPANSEEIKIAREYGDLRENFEYKAAKEMQSVLMRRKAELEHDLGKARGTDFANPDTSQVSIGTTVKVRDLATGNELEYSLLGAWDSIPERNILSYQTAIGQNLLGKRISDHATLPTDSGNSLEVEIIQIEVFEQAEEFVV